MSKSISKTNNHFSRQHPGQGTTNACVFSECILEFCLDGSNISAESKKIGPERRGQGKGHSLGLSWHLSQQGTLDVDQVSTIPLFAENKANCGS